MKIPLPQEGFPSPKSFVRGHGPRWSSHPPPPWPRWAAARPTRGRSRLPNAAVFRLGKMWPHGPSPAGRTQRNGREKNFETILAPQKWKFCKLWPLQLLTKVKQCCFEMSWGHRIALKNNCFWHSIEAMSVVNLTQTYFNSRKKVRSLLGHRKF